MSRQVRNRVTAIVLGGLIFGAPMLANGTASAEPVPEGTRQVTFTGGGMFGISCGSEPSVESMTVPAQSTIRVVNETGYAAKLLLAGDTKGTLADNASTEVIFRRGTTSVLVKPNCATGDEASPMMVTASPSASATTLPDPAPAAPSDDVTPMSLAPTGPGDSSGTPSGSKAAPAERPSRHQSGTTRTGVSKQPDLRTGGVTQAGQAAGQGLPHGGAAPQQKIKTKAASGTAGSAAPAFSGMPPGDEKTLLAGVPRLDVDPVTVTAEPAAPAPPPTQIAAAEPVATLEPMRESGPLGLLALTAAVCVVGVTVAAIRAFVSQRTNRAHMA